MPEKKTSYIKKAQQALGIDTESNIYKQLQPVRVDKKEEKRTHYKVLFPNAIQCDLQFWPSDNGYRYLVTCINTVSQGVDFEAIKSKSAEVVIKALEKILERKLVGEDIKYISVDNGSEFVNEKFIKWASDHHYVVRVGRVGRHNQIAYVDYLSLIISKVLNIKCTIEQDEKIKAKKKSIMKHWVQYLPKLREVLNDKEVKVKLISDFFTKSKEKPKFKIGELVFVRNEQPRGNQDEKLSGKFRTGDFFYDRTPRKIVDIKHTYDNNPPRYIVEGIKNATFASWELIKAL